MKDDEYWVKSGDLETGTWRLSKDIFTNGTMAIKLAKLTSCTIVKDEHSTTQSGSGRIAGGILGAALLGPIGAIGGLLSGGKKRVDQTIIHCGFDDGRSFTAESTQIGAASFVRISQQNLNRAQIAKHEASPTAAGIGDDQIECPQCAELIKRKAKICRFCGISLTGSDSPTQAVEQRSGSLNGPYSRFLADYRSQVKDSPFSTDQSVVDIFDEIRTLQNSDPEADFFKNQQRLAKKLNVSTLDLEKVFSYYWQAKELVDNYIRSDPPGSLFGDLDRDQILLMLQSLSECRLQNSFNSGAEEKEAVSRAMTDKSEKVVHTGYISRMRLGLPFTIRSSPFYVIDDHVVCVDEGTRKRKPRKKAAKSNNANSKLNAILESPEFLEWANENVPEDVDSVDVVKLYCGACEVEKLAVEKGVNEDLDWSDAFVYQLLDYWREDASKGKATPDEWLASRYEQLIDGYNNDSDEDYRLDGKTVIDAFSNGFNSI